MGSDYQGLTDRALIRLAEGGLFKQPDVAAAFELGRRFLASGPRNDERDLQAVNWFRKAAEQGNSEAQFQLGFAYVYGTGVKQDHNEATIWFRKAAENGHAPAQCELGYRIAMGIPAMRLNPTLMTCPAWP